MKFLFALILLFSINKTYCQYIHKSSKELKDIMTKANAFDVSEKGTSKEGNEYCMFKKKDNSEIFIAYLKNDTCINYKFVFANKYTVKMLQYLNSNYNRLTENTWLSKDNITEVLFELRKNEGFFTLYYKEI